MIRVLSIEQTTTKVSSAALTQPEKKNLRSRSRQAETEQVIIKKEPEEDVQVKSEPVELISVTTILRDHYCFVCYI